MSNVQNPMSKVFASLLDTRVERMDPAEKDIGHWTLDSPSVDIQIRKFYDAALHDSRSRR